MTVHPQNDWHDCHLTVLDAAKLLRLFPGTVCRLISPMRILTIRIFACSVRISRYVLLLRLDTLTGSAPSHQPTNIRFLICGVSRAHHGNIS